MKVREQKVDRQFIRASRKDGATHGRMEGWKGEDELWGLFCFHQEGGELRKLSVVVGAGKKSPPFTPTTK